MRKPNFELLKDALKNIEIELPDEIEDVGDDDSEKPRRKFSGEVFDAVELDWFVGKTFKLTGVGSEQVANTESCRDDDVATCFSFILDGKCYTAMENPEDGYRSSMRELVVTKGASISNRFKGVKVVGQRRSEDQYQKHSVIELVDAVTDKVVIEFGTANTDEYYPYFVSGFHPENMVLNETLEAAQARIQQEQMELESAVLDLTRDEELAAGWGEW
ncbi:hypothetical protein [Paraburkholderia sp.]|uniref:hypothetical protein n=1 Tax=Paraburkholderia sp. TaxID=1926495 RepID=UPI0039E4C9FA